MRSNLAIAFNRFAARDDSSVKVWENPPPRDVIDDFKRHVREYGTPDLWQWHLHTKPPRGCDYKIVCADVTIPEKLRPDVHMAPCPNCSIASPKYFTCRLLWFPAEKALRAIGHECAKDISGENFLRAEEARHAKEQSVNRALSFIIDNAGNIAPMIAQIDELLPRIRKVDEYADLLHKALPEKTRKGLARLADNGALPLTETRQVPALDRQGRPIFDKEDNPVLHDQDIVVESIPVAGLKLLAETKKFEGQLISARMLISALATAYDDDAIQALCERLGDDGLLQAEKAIRNAWQIVKAAVDRLALTQSLFDVENMKRLAHWGRDDRASLRFKISFITPGRVEIGDWSFRKHKGFYLCSEVSDPIPQLVALA
jgi:hypothetical protein